MPLVTSSTHTPPFYLFNAHLQTIIPSLLRKVKGVNYRRERIQTPDGDFLDLDWSSTKSLANTDKRSPKLAILSHGLEGDSSRPYILGMVRELNAQGWDALAWNFRGCSGETNHQLRFYHSGATDDLGLLVTHALQSGQYTSIALIGFSLGGNLTLKYLGEKAKTLPHEIKRAVVFSVPLDLQACSTKLSEPGNVIYHRRFLKSLRQKIAIKVVNMPERLSLEAYQHVKTLQDFDEYYTAPLHGFLGAVDYYHRCSAKNFLSTIAIPTLIVNAQNDPFLPAECYAEDLVKDLPEVFLEIPEKGGHCGFFSKTLHGTYWSEERALQFISA
ncbi:MAG: alpha/beta fold hydrolase [Bacteroidota bacterium]